MLYYNYNYSTKRETGVCINIIFNLSKTNRNSQIDCPEKFSVIIRKIIRRRHYILKY